jgi:hypothetical protein
MSDITAPQAIIIRESGGRAAEAGEIRLDRRVWGQLQTGRDALKGLLTSFGEALGRSRISGTEVRLTFVVDPQGHAEALEIEEAAPDALDRALTAARERGAARAAQILAGPEMLSADDFARLIGVSREAVRLKRRRHEVLGLEGAKRGVRYPKWQVSADGALLPELPKLFNLLGGQDWTVYRFLRQHHPEISGSTALEALQAGRVADVLAAAENASRGFS